MKATLTALLAGLLFGVGLVLSGMADPAKVQGFLDVTGRWDPSLGLVMGGGLAAHGVLRGLIARRARPLFDPRFHPPTPRHIDLRLVLGAALFGVGWGLGGYCPGPGVVAAGAGGLGGLTFALAMLAGFLVHDAPRAPR